MAPYVLQRSATTLLVEGFSGGSAVVSDVDARDFLRAIDHKVVTIGEGGRFRMPQSKTFEVIFWEHSTKMIPRPITLWLEPVITIAAAARLHLDYGWPLDCLGMQSADNAFDLMAFRPGAFDREHIAGEIKPTLQQLNALLKNFQRCCAGDHDPGCISGSRKNAHRKWVALRDRRPPVFWAVGPSYESRVFGVGYAPDVITLVESDATDLRFPNSRVA